MKLARKLVAAVAWIVATPVGGATAAESQPPLPYTLAVQVEYGVPKGPDSLLDEIRQRVVHDLAPRDLFVDIVEWEHDDRAPANLLLRIKLDDLRRETHYDRSMAERRELTDPLSEQEYTVEFEVIIDVDLLLLPEGVPVRSTRFREAGARRPRYLGEDVEAALREEAVRDLVRSIRRSVFKGSPAKLDRKIDKVRQEAAADAR